MTARFAILPAHAADDPELSALELRVLIAIGRHLNRENEAWPSQTLLAERLGKTRESINRAIRVLRERGYLKIEHTKRADGGNGAAVYQVVLEPDVVPVFSSDAERHRGGSDAERQEGSDVPASHAKELPNRTQSSVSNETGEDADLFGDSKPKKPPSESKAQAEEDPYKRLIFTAGLKLLTDQGMGEGQARGFLAAQIRVIGTAELANAITACERAKPGDAKSWLVAAVKARAKKAGVPTTGKAPTEAERDAILNRRFAEFAANGRWMLHYGPRPDDPAADYPEDLYRCHGLKRWAEEGVG